jgi:hypothetical protein
MKTASITCCAVLLIAQSVVSTACSANATAQAEATRPCLLGHDAALEIIGKARGIISAAAVHEENGDIPRTLAAFRCVVQAPDAVEQLLWLLDKGGVPAQLYALIGLKALNPAVFAGKIPAYLARKDRVVLMGGDVEARQTVGAVSADIRDDRYSVLISASTAATDQPQGGFTKE